jgi:Protein of unknown function (DUF2914)
MKISFRKICAILFLAVVLAVPGAAWCREVLPSPAAPRLVKAVMCEAIEKFAPVNQAVVFSIDLGRVSCFTEFDQVVKQRVIYHRWYHKGRLVSVKQFMLNPPRWSSFSSMQLRDTDKGPWQVDITDENGIIISILRFSITE